MTQHHHPKPKDPIAMTPVKSTSVNEVGYDAATQTLALRFKNGTLYHYPGVPAGVHAGIAASDSVGRYLQANVLGKFPATRQTHRAETA